MPCLMLSKLCHMSRTHLDSHFLLIIVSTCYAFILFQTYVITVLSHWIVITKPYKVGDIYTEHNGILSTLQKKYVNPAICDSVADIMLSEVNKTQKDKNQGYSSYEVFKTVKCIEGKRTVLARVWGEGRRKGTSHSVPSFSYAR